jgi:hypothetical protein
MTVEPEAKARLFDRLSQGFAWRAEHIYRSDWPGNSSPLYEQLSARVAADPDILALVLEADRSTQVENLLFGAVHFLLLGGAAHPLAEFYASLSPSPRPPQEAYPHFRAFCLDHAETIGQLVTTQRVQTNEVQRCTALIPAFELVFRQGGKRPLTLVEIGASAGLNLLWDHYHYDYGQAGAVGQDQAPVRLACEVRGNEAPPLPVVFPAVAHRVGIDINPVDVNDETVVRWLKALIWPEHTDRARLLAQAIEVARRKPVALLKGNAAEVLLEVVAGLPQETNLCIYHSYTLNQCPQPVRDQINDLLLSLSRERSFFRLSLEWYARQSQPQLELYGYTPDQVQQQLLAYCESHGRWLEWLLA